MVSRMGFPERLALWCGLETLNLNHLRIRFVLRCGNDSFDEHLPWRRILLFRYGGRRKVINVVRSAHTELSARYDLASDGNPSLFRSERLGARTTLTGSSNRMVFPGFSVMIALPSLSFASTSSTPAIFFIATLTAWAQIPQSMPKIVRSIRRNSAFKEEAKSNAVAMKRTVRVI